MSGRALDVLYKVKPRVLWGYFKSERASFWLICLYLFFEYVRPQQIYPAFAGLGLVRWTLIACFIAWIAERRFRSWNAADIGLAVYSTILLLSCFTAYQPDAAFNKLEAYFTWVLVYILISSIVNTEKRFFFFMLTYVIWCLKMSQHGARSWALSGFGFVDWGTTCAPGFFHNSGECGIQMAMFFPVALFFFLGLRVYWSKWKRYFFAAIPVTAAMTIVASSSRGALLALAGVGLWMLSKSRRYFFRSLIGIAVASAVIYQVIPPEQMERFQTMGDDDTSQSRLTYWRHGREIMKSYPLTGIGYENWLPYYINEIDKKGQLPHNIFIQAGAELGYPGLLTFIALILITFFLNRRTRKLLRPLGDRGKFLHMMAHGLDCALVGYAISGYFVTVLYYPFFWINLAMTVALYNTAQQVAASPSIQSRQTASVPLATRGLVPPPSRR